MADVPPPIRIAISQILIPNVRIHIWQIRWQMYLPPLEWQFHKFWFLLWHLIFDRPEVADLTLQNSDFHLVLIDSYCENSYLADQVTDVPPPIRVAVSQMLIPTVDSSYWSDQGWQIYSPNGDFWLVLIESYCENSYLADQVADLPPKMVIFNWYW